MRQYLLRWRNKMDESKVVTMHEALLAKNPELYEKILGDRVRAEKLEKKKALGAKERKELKERAEGAEETLKKSELVNDSMEEKIDALESDNQDFQDTVNELHDSIGLKDEVIAKLKVELEIAQKQVKK